jgi:hypothetical protein
MIVFLFYLALVIFFLKHPVPYSFFLHLISMSTSKAALAPKSYLMKIITFFFLDTFFLISENFVRSVVFIDQLLLFEKLSILSIAFCQKIVEYVGLKIKLIGVCKHIPVV